MITLVYLVNIPILSQSDNATVFYFDNISFLEHVLIVEQIPGAIFQGDGLRSTTFVLYIKVFVLACSFQIKHLPT